MQRTFKYRVEKFWNWFSESSDRFYQMIEDGNFSDLSEEFQVVCRDLLPGLAWVFGPGEGGVGHSFTLTAEGNLNRQFLSRYWLEQAPGLKGWTFYSSRQPSRLSAGDVIEVQGLAFDPKELWVEPSVDEGAEMIHLAFWHPNFPQSDENLRHMVLNLWLDESLGEIAAQGWISSTEVRDVSQSEKAMPIIDFKAFVDGLKEERGWEKWPPDEVYTNYQLPQPSDAFTRADTIAGTTCNMGLVGEYLNSADQMEDKLEGTGAEFIFIGIDSSQLPKGREVETRGELEDLLDQVLGQNKSGRVFGGAMGISSVYLDLVIFDGERSIEIIQGVLDAKGGWGGSYFIRPFANHDR